MYQHLYCCTYTNVGLISQDIIIAGEKAVFGQPEVSPPVRNRRGYGYVYLPLSICIHNILWYRFMCLNVTHQP